MLLMPKMAVATNHSNFVLSAIGDLLQQEILRDFTIIVEGEYFHVHATLLAACSPYFRVMLSRANEEKTERIVEIKGVKASAVNQCIVFMYTGFAEVTMQNAQDVLKAATFMQLDRMLEICNKNIVSLLSPENCLKIKGFVQLYPDDHLQNKTEDYIEKHFESVIRTDEFLDLSKDDCLIQVSKYAKSDGRIWKATIAWVRHTGERIEHLDLFLSCLHLEEFPTIDLLRDVLEFLTAVNPSQLGIFFRRIFSDISILEAHLTMENCFIIENLANNYDHVTREAFESVITFLKENFEQVLARKEFYRLKNSNVLWLFEDNSIDTLASDKLRWIAAVRWAIHNKDEHGVFHQLIKTINFAKFSHDYIQHSVRKSPVFQDCSKCSCILMDAAFNDTQIKNQPRDIIAVLLSEELKIMGYNLDDNKWFRIPYQIKEIPLRVFAFNERLCALTHTAIIWLGTDQKWKVKKRLPRNESFYDKKIIAVEDQLYFVGETNMICYDILKNKWDVNLPGCNINHPFCVTSFKNYIYLFSEKGTRIYCISERTWTVIDNHKSTGYSANELYGKIFVSGSTVLQCFDPISYSWNNITMKNIGPHVTCRGERKLIAITENSGNPFLQIYDEVCLNWKKLEGGQKSRNNETPSTGGIFGSRPTTTFGNTQQSNFSHSFGSNLFGSVSPSGGFGDTLQKRHGIFGSQPTATCGFGNIQQSNSSHLFRNNVPFGSLSPTGGFGGTPAGWSILEKPLTPLSAFSRPVQQTSLTMDFSACCYKGFPISKHISYQ